MRRKRLSHELRRGLALLVCAAIAAPMAAHAGGVASLVEDLDQTPGEFSAVGAARLERIGGALFFAGRDADHGQELWWSDGTPEGTALVEDIRPGPIGSFPSRTVDVGGVAYFRADDGVHGVELWRSDGTPEGTFLVADINPGPGSSEPMEMRAVGGRLFFSAHDGIHGWEPFRSDGTPEGTVALGDLVPGDPASNPRNFTDLNGAALFIASDLEHGLELWRSDGTPEGTAIVRDINPGPPGIFSQFGPRGALPVLNGFAYFPADDGEHSHALWRSDGTEDGTVLVASGLVIGDDAARFPLARIIVDGQVIFSTTDGFSSNALWKTDGTNVELIASAGPPPGDYNIVESNGLVYFVTGNDEAERTQLWKTDLTLEGTELLHDISTPACAPRHYFGRLTPFGDGIILVGLQTGGDEEIWTSDGTPEGTHRVADIRENDGSEPRSLRALGDRVYFIADDGVHGREIWQTDGTDEGTTLLVDLLQGSDHFFHTGMRFEELDGKLYFSDLNRLGLWSSDGTAAGTGVVPGTESLRMPRAFRRPDPTLLATGEQLFFWSAPLTFLLDLWRTEGSEASTQLVAGGFSSSCPPNEVVAIGEKLFFAICGPSNTELWKSEGGSTSRVHEIRPGLTGSNPRGLTVLGKNVLFFADDGVHGTELWRSDGTAAGTALVKDIRPGTNPGAGFDLPLNFGFGFDKPRAPMIVGDGVAYFVANDGPHGRELWKSDGTEAGTVIVRDIIPGTLGGLGLTPNADGLGAWDATDDGTLYFLRFGFPPRWELWKSDGTEDGTVFLAEVADQSFFHGDLRLFAIGDTVYFSRQDESGGLLWRTNGTAITTGPFPEIVPTLGLVHEDRALYFATGGFRSPSELRVIDEGVDHSASIGTIETEAGGPVAESVTSVQGRRYFVADDGVHGAELWISSCGDGLVEHDEACDDGARNGLRGSCCTRGCEVRTTPAVDTDGDTSIDWCDTQEGSLALDLVSIQRRPRTARADARVLFVGRFAVAPTGFDVDRGIEVRVQDANGLELSGHLTANDCQVRPGGRIRCRSKDGSLDLRLRLKGDRGDVRVTWKELSMEEGLEGPVTVSLTHDAVLDRVGVSGPCRGSANRLSCR